MHNASPSLTLCCNPIEAHHENSTFAGLGAPHLCDSDNVEVTSVGVLFTDAAGRLVVNSDGQDIKVSISLEGPFYKTIGQVTEQLEFSMGAFANMVYSYTAARDGACGTAQSPFCFDVVCHGNTRHVTRDAPSNFALPSPYAHWKVKVLEGASDVAARTANVLIVVTYWGQLAERDPYACARSACPHAAEELPPLPSTPPSEQADGMMNAIAGIVGGALAFVVVLAGGQYVVQRRRRSPGAGGGFSKHVDEPEALVVMP